jgi:hypothetical protein
MSETDREFWVKELARYRPLSVMSMTQDILGLPLGSEIVRVFLSSTPWEDWGLNGQGDEERSEGSTLEFEVGYLIDGKSDFQLNPFRKVFQGEDAITKVDTVMEFLLGEIGRRA